MNNKSDVLAQWFDTRLASLSNRLQPVLKDSRSTGKIGSAIQKAPQGIYGFVSFSPHGKPEEENIDATLFINLGEKIAKMSADICWSDGDMIGDFGDYKIGYSSLVELSEKIEKIYSQIEGEIFQKMAELIKSDLPPKYRRE